MKSKKLIVATVLLLSSIFMPIPIFADEINVDGSWTPTTGQTDAGDVSFTSNADIMLTPNKETKVNRLIKRKGKYITQSTTLEKLINEHVNISQEDKDAYFKAVFATHLVKADVNNNDGSLSGAYSKDGSKKDYTQFVPDGASDELESLIKWGYEKLDAKHNGAISTGDYAITFIAFSKEDLDNYRKQTKKSIPKKLEEAFKSRGGELEPEKKSKPPVRKSNRKIYDLNCDVGRGSRYTLNTKTEQGAKVEGAYSIMVTIIPPKPQGFERLTPAQQSEWARTHHTQVVGPVKTEFGNYLDNNRELISKLREMGKLGGIGENSDYRRAWEQFKKGAEQAIQKGKPDLQLLLTDENFKGNTRGGVLTFTEQVKNVTISTVHTQDLYNEYACVTKKHKGITIVEDFDENGNLKKVERPYTYTLTHYQLINTKAKIDGNYTQGEVIIVDSGNYTPTYSYQTLTVKCNEDEFNKVVATTNSTIISKTRAAQTARSPIIHNQFAQFFNHLTKEFFYNGKSCKSVYSCTAEKGNFEDDRDNNKRNTGNLVNDKYFGSQIDGKVASQFAIFRDNQAKAIRNDIWYPSYNYANNTAVGLMYDRKPAHRTYLVLDKNGTPKEDFFKLFDKNDKLILTGKDLQRKWAFSILGQENIFKWQSSWASDSGKPHRINILYGYKGKVDGVIPVRYNRQGGGSIPQSSVLDLLCLSQFNSLNATEPIIVNGPKELEDELFTQFQNNPNSYYEVNFVKSSAE